jgi:hypothetical protein
MAHFLLSRHSCAPHIASHSHVSLPSFPRSVSLGRSRAVTPRPPSAQSTSDRPRSTKAGQAIRQGQSEQRGQRKRGQGNEGKGNQNNPKDTLRTPKDTLKNNPKDTVKNNNQRVKLEARLMTVAGDDVRRRRKGAGSRAGRLR